MKKIFIVCLAFILLGSLGNLNYTQAESMPRLLPQDTELMIHIRSIKTLHTHLKMTDTSILGEPVEDLEDIQKAFGFNPLNLKALQQKGFDIEKPCGFFMADFKLPSKEEIDDPGANIVAVLPVTHPDNAMQALKTMLKNEMPKIKFSQDKKLIVFEEAEEGLKGVLAQKPGYLMIGTAINTPKNDIKALMKASSYLADSKNYQGVTDRLNPDKDIWVYANFQKAIKDNEAEIERMIKNSDIQTQAHMESKLQYMKDTEGAGLAFDLGKPHLNILGVMNIIPGSDFLKLVTNRQFNKKTVLGFSDHPLMMLSSAFNPLEYYNSFLKSMDTEGRKEFDKQTAEIKNNYKIDLEKEVIANMDGNINIGVYDGLSINMSNYNTLMTLSVKDEAKAKAALDKAVANCPKEEGVPSVPIESLNINGTNAYMMNFMGMIQVYAGIKDHNFILAVGKPMFEKALKANPAAGFVSKIKDKNLSETLKNDKGLFYLNINELISAVKNFSMMIQQMTQTNPFEKEAEDAMRKIEYVLASQWDQTNTLYADLTVKTKFSEPFFQGMAKIADTFDRLSQKAAEPKMPENSEQKEKTPEKPVIVQ